MLACALNGNKNMIYHIIIWFKIIDSVEKKEPMRQVERSDGNNKAYK